MAYKKDRIAGGLDRAAIAVAGPNSETGTGPRMLLIVNLIFLLVGIAGMVLAARGDFGPWVVFAAMIGATTHTIIAEYRKRGDAPLDEREKALAWKTVAIGGMVPLVLVALYMLFLGPFADNGLWSPQTKAHWQATGFFILGLSTQITNIASALMTPSYAAEFDLDD